jgi:predicted DNA-binding ribbon-helix-helix protein
MKSGIAKRSIVVDGHKASVSLEDAFWRTLKDIAQERGETLSQVVAAIRSPAPARESVVGDPAVRARLLPAGR